MAAPRVTRYELTFEDAHESDVTAIHDIEMRSFDTPWSYRILKQEVTGNRPHSRVIVARLRGLLVAYAIMWTVVDEMHIINFAVDPEFRRRGIANALMDHIFAESRRIGAPRITLEVRMSNEAAIQLYEKAGFKTVAIRRAYYEDNREDALVMWADATGNTESPP